MRRASPRRNGLIASLVLGAAAALLGTFAVPASAAAGPHPCFNDQGAIPWYRNLAEAQAAARASGKLIFVESGRLECSQCRRLVAGIVAYEPVRSRMAGVAVGFADDCDESNPAMQALFSAHLPNATMLPLVCFLTPDLQWVTGWSGAKMIGPVLDEVSIAESWQRRLTPKLATAAPPACTGSSCSAPRPAPSLVAPMGKPETMSTPERPAARPVAPPPPPRTSPAPLKTTPSPTPVVPSREAPRPLATPSPPAPSAALPSPSSTPRAAARAEPPAPASAPPPVPSIAPITPPLARAASPIERARLAAARESWGEVIRIADREFTASEGPEATEMEQLFDRACLWTQRVMSEAERAALEHRTADARKTLDRMKRELEGTGSPALVDADRGLRAVDAMVAIDAGSPDGADGVETIRRRAYAEFRGSRWAPLFRSR